MEEKLKKLVEISFKAGYDVLDINARASNIGHNTLTGVGHIHGLFYDNTKEPRIHSWPAIWKLSDQVGIKASCGNSHQRQTHDILNNKLPLTVVKINDLVKTKDYEKEYQTLKDLTISSLNMFNAKDSETKHLFKQIYDEKRENRLITILTSDIFLFLVNKAVENKDNYETSYKIYYKNNIYSLPLLDRYFCQKNSFKDFLKRIYKDGSS